MYYYMFRQGFRYEHAEMVPNVVKSREGWELYIVTDGEMVGLLQQPPEHNPLFTLGSFTQ
jgi:hypothetical protein